MSSGSVRLLVATRNRGKLAELARMLGPDARVSVVGLDDVGPVPEVVEDGDTFEHNAAKKARETAAATSLLTLADDSGLEVDALGGAPGVRSARYAGEDATDATNNDKLLAELASVPDEERTARFRCVLALADPNGPLGEAVHLEHGVCEGCIAHAPKGDHGFGYDPLFVPVGEAATLGELDPTIKDRISHRAAALRSMQRFLQRYIEARGR